MVSIKDEPRTYSLQSIENLSKHKSHSETLQNLYGNRITKVYVHYDCSISFFCLKFFIIFIEEVDTHYLPNECFVLRDLYSNI